MEDQMGSPGPSPRRGIESTRIVNRAKEYIERHWRENLQLDQIAAQVFVSPFHFQRIFKKETGETPKEYLTRIRLEGAVQMIRVDLQKSVYDVGVDCGFSSQSVFARAFRQRYGVSATELRNLPFSEVAKLPVWGTDIRKVYQDHLHAIVSPGQRKRFFDSITFERIEPLDVIYLPTTMKSEEHIGDEFRKLASLAAAHDLTPNVTQCYGIMYDFPLHTPLDKCRYRVCIPIPAETTVHLKVFRMKIPGGKYAVYPLKGDFETMIRHSILFFSDWLRESHYERAEHFLLERFTSLPGPTTYTKLRRELYVSIKPA
jgi:AraC family transcriptional regulator